MSLILTDPSNNISPNKEINLKMQRYKKNSETDVYIANEEDIDG